MKKILLFLLFLNSLYADFTIYANGDPTDVPVAINGGCYILDHLDSNCRDVNSNYWGTVLRGSDQSKITEPGMVYTRCGSYKVKSTYMVIDSGSTYDSGTGTCNPAPPCLDGFTENSDGICETGDGCHNDGSIDPSEGTPSGWIFYGAVGLGVCKGLVDNITYVDSMDFALACDPKDYCMLKLSSDDCPPGYTKNSMGVCKPDISCPPSMLYHYVPAPWYQFDIKTCVPNPNISKDDCLNFPGASYNEPGAKGYLFGSVGCIDKSYYLSKHIAIALGFNPFSGLATQPDLLGSFISKIFNYTKGKSYAMGKNLWNSISDKFKNLSNANLFNTEPDIVNFTMGDDGVFYDVVPTPKTPQSPSSGWKDIYDKYIKNGWDFPTASGDTSPDVPDLRINTPEFPTSTVSEDLFYQGGDSTAFDDSMLATANQADRGSLPDLTPLEDLPEGSQIQTTIKLFEDFTQTTEKDFPATMVKTATHIDGDTVLTDYVGDLHFPDGSSSHITITKRQFPDGHSINIVQTTNHIPTESGTKLFNTSYVTTLDSAGDVTNVTNDGSSIVSSGTDGTTTTTTNNPSDTSVTTNEQPPAIDLTPAVNKLDSIDNGVKDLNQKLDDMMNFKPANASEADATSRGFRDALNVFDANFGDYKDFIGGIKGNIQDITVQFNDAKAILENKPQIQEITGQCGFNAHFYNKDYFVDPCRFVSPYRSLLALFFTFVGTLQALAFATKYLVRT